MMWRRSRGCAATVIVLAGFLSLPLPEIGAQAPQGAVVRELFAAYEYYEDSPETRSGIPSVLTLDAGELEFIRLTMREQSRSGFVLLSRKDGSHWMGLERSGGTQLVRIRDAGNEYNARIAVDMVSGRMTVLRGVDYKPFNDTEDASVAAYLAAGYLRRAMAKGEIFPQTLRMPSIDLASRGVVGVAAGVTAAPAAGAAPTGPADGLGYLRLWSTSAAAARELFAADRFGNDSLLEAGDFTQATLSYTDSEGPHALTGKELEVSILGRVRLPENPLRMDELETMLSKLASRVGGLDLSITPMRTTLYIPSAPPRAAASAPAGSRDPALWTFEYLQSLGLLAGDYTVVPEAAMAAPGFTEEDLELYWWARLQRAGVPGALYPPAVDSGGKLPWGEFALFATIGLGRSAVPCTIVMIRRPQKSAVPYHAVCIYQIGKSWRWMDSGRIGDESADDWRLVPARIYGRDVTYRVVDVAREWLRDTPDESSGWLLSRIGP